MTVFGFSVLRNTVDDATNFISQKSGIIGQLWSKHDNTVHGHGQNFLSIVVS